MFRPGNGIGWILSIGASSLEGRTVRSTSRVRPLSAAYSRRAVVVEAHLLQDRQLDLQELDRHPADVSSDSVTTAAASRLIASTGSSEGE